MATPEIFLVAKTLISALARVNEVNAGVTTPEHVLEDISMLCLPTSNG